LKTTIKDVIGGLGGGFRGGTITTFTITHYPTVRFRLIRAMSREEKGERMGVMQLQRREEE
jgi:hypothetical protein